MFCFKHKCKKDIRKKPHIAVVVAFYREFEQIIRFVDKMEKCQVGLTTYYILEYKGKEFLLYVSGVGLKRAWWNTRKFLHRFNITTLVLSGIAANLEHGNKVGDTLVAKEWIRLDKKRRLQIDTQLLEKAQKNTDVRVVKTGATSNNFITDTSILPEGVSSIDMETYEIARIAEKKHVPFIAFRTISDHGDGKETGEDFDTAARISAQKVLSFITKTKI